MDQRVYEFSADGDYSYTTNVETETGTWETKNGKLYIKETVKSSSILVSPSSRSGTYSVTDTELVFTTGGKSYYYKKQ